MYCNIKSCVSLCGSFSSFFSCENGVRQGENLSPVLFALFLNDMQTYIESRGVHGIELFDNDQHELWLRLLVLLYADDTVILSDNADDFQNCLTAFNDYCNEWHLHVNLSKTKIIIFGARNTNNFNFTLGNGWLDITNTYHYLGITFSASGSFLNARKYISQQAKKAMHLLFARAQYADLPIDLILKLFDHTVLPILTYGAEIYGFENLDIIENVHKQFLRKLLKARKSTPLYMLYGEVGRYPISITIKCRMIAFWTKLLSNHNKISSKIYFYMLRQQINNSKWLNKIKEILDSVGQSDFWLHHLNNGHIPLNLHKLVKQILIDQYHQEWQSSMLKTNKGKIYKLGKKCLKFESYFKILPMFDALMLFKFRTANHKLPIEIGLWDGTIFENRKCNLCQRDEIGSEKHYLFSCDYFKVSRRRFLLNLNIDDTEYNYMQLMQCTSEHVMFNLARFAKVIMATFN